ncbi:unnamed protein product [Mytilus coruscus]|uniref:Peptidase A2 domain-containing protein n=1 Tax=Mytilus coruscus TaxID=42192 RepID=A0A6J8C404_MYTCO|nr:unnamed protein product [Mytilus coruscus]
MQLNGLFGMNVVEAIFLRSVPRTSVDVVINRVGAVTLRGHIVIEGNYLNAVISTGAEVTVLSQEKILKILKNKRPQMDADWIDFKADVDNITNLGDNPFVSKICAVTRSQNSKLIDSNWLDGYTSKELENFAREDNDLWPIHKWQDNNCKPNRDEIAS